MERVKRLEAHAKFCWASFKERHRNQRCLIYRASRSALRFAFSVPMLDLHGCMFGTNVYYLQGAFGDRGERRARHVRASVYSYRVPCYAFCGAHCVARRPCGVCVWWGRGAGCVGTVHIHYTALRITIYCDLSPKRSRVIGRGIAISRFRFPCPPKPAATGPGHSAVRRGPRATPRELRSAKLDHRATTYPLLLSVDARRGRPKEGGAPEPSRRVLKDPSLP